MHFSTISAVLALATSVYAQTANFDAITSPTQDQNVAVGSTLDIVWQPTAAYNKDTVTITLLEGATPATLSLGDVIVGGIANTAGKYSWTIPSSVGSFATYGFKLSLDSDSSIFQYSFPFHITGSSSSYSASGTSALSTKTLTLSTGTGYSASATSTTSSANITSIIKTASSNSSTLYTVSSVKPTGNSTLSYVAATTAPGSSATKTGAASTSTSSAPATATTNAAVANIASGSMALFGGFVLAFAL